MDALRHVDLGNRAKSKLHWPVEVRRSRRRGSSGPRARTGSRSSRPSRTRSWRTSAGTWRTASGRPTRSTRTAGGRSRGACRAGGRPSSSRSLAPAARAARPTSGPLTGDQGVAREPAGDGPDLRPARTPGGGAGPGAGSAGVDGPVRRPLPRVSPPLDGTGPEPPGPPDRGPRMGGAGGRVAEGDGEGASGSRAELGRGEAEGVTTALQRLSSPPQSGSARRRSTTGG